MLEKWKEKSAQPEPQEEGKVNPHKKKWDWAEKKWTLKWKILEEMKHKKLKEFILEYWRA